MNYRLPALDELLRNASVPTEVRRTLAVVEVPFTDLDGCERLGCLIVHSELTVEVATLFREIHQARFPIERMEPLHKYDWSDDRSMADNNTSAFNYRLVDGTDRLSMHAYGWAIDINPLMNPWQRGDAVTPPGATYDPTRPGTITEHGPVVCAFKARGWSWGGDWLHQKDWHHFEKS